MSLQELQALAQLCRQGEAKHGVRVNLPAIWKPLVRLGLEYVRTGAGTIPLEMRRNLEPPLQRGLFKQLDHAVTSACMAKCT